MKTDPKEQHAAAIVDDLRSSPKLSITTNGEKHTTPVIRLQHILAPVDFSEGSRQALKYAVAFAREFQAAITVLHVVPDVAPGYELSVPAPDLQASLVRDARQWLANEVQRYPEEWADLKPLVRKGVPFNEIVQAAKDLCADLIVVGTHGRTGLKRMLLGSTAERVVRHAACPVMVVRGNEHDFVTE